MYNDFSEGQPREGAAGLEGREVATENQGAAPGYEDMLAALDAVETPNDAGAEALPALRATSRTLASALQESGKRPKLGERAAAITHDLLDIVEEAARSGELDVNDALRLLPPVHRVREHDDKMDQMNNGGKPLPTIIWNIDLGGTISAKVMPAAEVVDVMDVVESHEEAQAGGAGEHDPHPQQSGMVFELFPVQQRAGSEGDAA